MAKAIPDGYHSVTPYIICKGAAAAIDFYKAALGATETCRLTMPDGSIAHAEIDIDGSKVMLGEESPEWGTKSPLALGGNPTGFALYVADCDAAFETALAAGATVEKPMADQFYGDRSGSVIDPFGHKWTFCTRKQEMTQAEMQAKMDEWLASMAVPAAA